MNSYLVKAGESISDVVINATGSLVNLDKVLNANNFTTWTPVLTAGQPVLIPDTVEIDQNALRDALAYPKCNTSVNDVFDQIAQIWQIMSDNWILTTGFWNDIAVWKDNKFWKD